MKSPVSSSEDELKNIKENFFLFSNIEYAQKKNFYKKSTFCE